MTGWGISACVCLLLIQSVFPDEEVFSSRGKRFYLGWAQFKVRGLSPSEDTFILTVSTALLEDVSVIVTTPLYDSLWREQFTVRKHHPHTVKLPHNLAPSDTELTNKGILVVAEDYVTVMGSINLDVATDMFLSIPETSLGDQYRALTVKGNPQLLVVGTKPNTKVTIHFKTPPHLGTLSSYFTGNVLRITLGELQTLQVTSKDLSADFTGVSVTADKPIAFFSGNFDFQTTDYTLNMLIPTNKWGTLYSIFRMPTQETHNQVKIIASESNTNILLGNGSTYALARAGDIWTADIGYNGYSTVVGDKPFMAGMVSKSFVTFGNGPNSRRKTSLVQLVPQNYYLSEYSWDSIKKNNNGDFSNFVSIIIDKYLYHKLILDNRQLVPGNVEAIEGSHNVHMSMPVTAGNHILTNRRHVNFLAIFSGTQNFTSYASIGGFGEGTKYVCEITGDPHVSMFSGLKIKLPLPCSYIVTKITVTNFFYKPGVRFYPEIEVLVHAANSRKDLWGRFFLTTVCCTVTLKRWGIRGPHNTYCIGEQLLRTHNNWITIFRDPLQNRVRFTYDPVKRVGTLKVTQTSVLVTFDLLKRQEGNLQKKTPGLAVEVNTKDLIYDYSVMFPTTICSTIDDNTSVQKIMQYYGHVRKSIIGIYAILSQPQVRFPYGFQDRLCPHLRYRFHTCPKHKLLLLRKCVHLVKPRFVKCFRQKSRNKVHAITVALECFNVVCSPNPNCYKLLEYAYICPRTHEFLDPIIETSCK